MLNTNDGLDNIQEEEFGTHRNKNTGENKETVNTV